MESPAIVDLAALNDALNLLDPARLPFGATTSTSLVVKRRDAVDSARSLPKPFMPHMADKLAASPRGGRGTG
jgi:hypothetical protein